jgi:MoxR-like ATPase
MEQMKTAKKTRPVAGPQTVTLTAVKKSIEKLIGNIKSVIYIDTAKLEYIIASNIAGGHVMLADSHGVGKTSLAKALAGSIDWNRTSNTVEPFSRIQCTVDLLPQDILGYNKIEGKQFDIKFHPGPIFAHFVLCDEINLLTPKTQGSFFQAMEERQVSVEGKTFTLPDPFFIISTMNLKGAHLFPLPAPQLDRFMIQLSMGMPGFDDEIAIIKQHGRDDAWKNFSPVISASDLVAYRSVVDKIEIHPDVVDYIARAVRETRNHSEIQMGASPRTGVKVSRLARALELIRGRSFVSVDTVKEIFVHACAHRLVLHDPSQDKEQVLVELLKRIPVERR